ncbi:MAG: radical SAM family heme chaperone HemW [Fidelibacterota bacterium]
MYRAGIYVHIPFCKSKCDYCDFYSVANQEALIPQFIKALVREIQLYDLDVTDWKLDSLFFGGGTPSLLEADHLETILTALETVYNLSHLEEITLEANPGEVSEKKLRDFRSLGINRLSLGAQALKPDLLKFLTRIHTPEQVLESISAARKAGFENINCDLIFNIPGQTFNLWKRDLETIIQLDLEHLSCYSLTVEEGTLLYRQVKNKEVKMPDSNRSAEWYYWTQKRLDQADFRQYEISNWAKLGKECRQNLHYWRIEPYLGFGPAAHGFDGKQRYSNFRSLDRYLKLVENGKLPRESIAENSVLDFTNELVGFGLRTIDGINLDKIPGPYKSTVKQAYQSKRLKWKNFCKKEGERIWLTPKGLIFADEIAVDLMI